MIITVAGRVNIRIDALKLNKVISIDWIFIIHKSHDKVIIERLAGINVEQSYLIIVDHLVDLNLSANHPVHPCAPAKGSAHAYTQNCASIHIESPEDAHVHAQQRTHLCNYFLTCLNNGSEPQ